MCESSWPMTPWSCSRSIASSSPVVTATAALSDLVPTAKALSVPSGIEVDLAGGGMLAAIEISLTTLIGATSSRSPCSGSGASRAAD